MTMTSSVTPAQLRALRLQAASLLASIDAALEVSGQPIPTWECPQCHTTLPPADGREVVVCQVCNYNDPKEPSNG